MELVHQQRRQPPQPDPKVRARRAWVVKVAADQRLQVHVRLRAHLRNAINTSMNKQQTNKYITIAFTNNRRTYGQSQSTQYVLMIVFFHGDGTRVVQCHDSIALEISMMYIVENAVTHAFATSSGTLRMRWR